MSRIGAKPIAIPESSKVEIKDHTIRVSGPKGTLIREIHPRIKVEIDEAKRAIVVRRLSDASTDKALHGLTRSLIAGMVKGVTEGYEKRIEVVGVGYNARIQGRDIVLQIGFTHPVKVTIPEGLQAETPGPTLIVIKGADKQLVGQFAANLRAIKPANPYTLKGIKYYDEVIRRKAGKTFVSGGG